MTKKKFDFKIDLSHLSAATGSVNNFSPEKFKKAWKKVMESVENDAIKKMNVPPMIDTGKLFSSFHQMHSHVFDPVCYSKFAYIPLPIDPLNFVDESTRRLVKLVTPPTTLIMWNGEPVDFFRIPLWRVCQIVAT